MDENQRTYQRLVTLIDAWLESTLTLDDEQLAALDYKLLQAREQINNEFKRRRRAQQREPTDDTDEGDEE